MKTGYVIALIFIVAGVALRFYGERVASFGLLEALSGLFLLVVGGIIAICSTVSLLRSIESEEEDNDDSV